MAECCWRCRGNSYSLRPQQIMYVLPGANFTEEDLRAIHSQAEADADLQLLETAWEACLPSLVSRSGYVALKYKNDLAFCNHQSCMYSLVATC